MQEPRARGREEQVERQHSGLPCISVIISLSEAMDETVAPPLEKRMN